MKVFLLASYDLSLTNFRGNLIADMVQRGHKVVAAAPPEHADIPEKLAKLGAAYEAIPFNRVGKNPLSDLALVRRLRRVLQHHRPDVCLSYTAKPVVYGSLAARQAGVETIASMITGSGFAFESDGIANRAVGWALRHLYRRALAVNKTVFFQNPDDLNAFVEKGFVPREKAVRIHGSGVDLDVFCQSPLPAEPHSFLLVSRMLRDKGISDFVAAARFVKERFPAAEFHLVGPIDPNPKGLKRHEIAEWEREGIVAYHGFQSDVRPFLERCSAFVLPSYYREGVPRTLLEALAVGRPVITTDSVGCRETVRLNRSAGVNGALAASEYVEGENGFLVPPRDPTAISRAMMRLIDEPALGQSMAEASRRLACEKFDVRIVNQTILEALGL